jgi:hypothetical protein
MVLIPLEIEGQLSVPGQAFDRIKMIPDRFAARPGADRNRNSYLSFA